jgi:hypothetical protein
VSPKPGAAIADASHTAPYGVLETAADCRGAWGSEIVTGLLIEAGKRNLQ